MNARAPLDTPFYFGAEQELFGLYHAPAKSLRAAVLLCPPIGQDQIRCHRLYRQLAQALAGEGIAALRFDYYGTGDSAGDSAELDWQRALADTRAAADALRSRSGTDRVLGFGARLGASVAINVADQAAFAGVVGWDPVLDGAAYVDGLDASQVALSADNGRFMVPRDPAETAQQWLGFATGTALREQLCSLHVTPPQVPTVVIDSLPTEAPRHWNGMAGSAVAIRPLQPSTPWDDPRKLEVAILSHPLIQAVSQHVKELAA